jgi:hypothetical protein
MCTWIIQSISNQTKCVFSIECLSSFQIPVCTRILVKQFKVNLQTHWVEVFLQNQEFLLLCCYLWMIFEVVVDVLLRKSRY